MWDFLSEVLKQYGFLAVVEVAQALFIFYLLKALSKKDSEVSSLQNKLLEMNEKRLEDVIDDREKYEELAEKLNISVDVLIKVIRRKNGNGSNCG